MKTMTLCTVNFGLFSNILKDLLPSSRRQIYRSKEFYTANRTNIEVYGLFGFQRYATVRRELLTEHCLRPTEVPR
jgi:hypothetical protein